MAVQLHSSIAVHPGPWLKRNVVDHFGLSVTELADHLRVSRQSMSKLLNGHQDLSAEMAIRFEKAFGLKADTLIRMQSAHELAQARAHEDEIQVERVAALSIAPTRSIQGLSSSAALADYGTNSVSEFDT